MADAIITYCVCNKEYVEGEFMIQCGKCNDWFHGICVGIEEYQAQDIDVYHCPSCQKVHGPLIYSFLDVTYENGSLQNVKKRRNVSRHNYKEIHEGTKQISTGSLQFIRQLKAKKFPSAVDVVTTLDDGGYLTAEYLQENHFSVPIIVENQRGLGLVVPPSNFTVYDVEKHVGSMHDLHVIDVAKQEDLRMKMREWTEYYNSSVRGKILNVISLEFSNTSLNNLVMAPEVVRNISWIENTWPQDPTDESTHSQPIVAKYCLMGVKDCYTDFHVDFGGTSVWYHVIRGEKIFFLIEPTDANLCHFEQWVSSSNQGEVFFGDKVDKCYKLVVRQGNTFFIPTGWIHAVWTPKDSLVFGGNFLHSFNIPLQLKIYSLEKSLKTPLKFLFPNFETANWYAAQSIQWKMEDIHHAGFKIPLFLLAGVKELLSVLKEWMKKNCEYSKFHKLQVPADVSALKIIKALEKEIKLDVRLRKPFPLHLQSPVLLSPSINKTVLKLKLPKKQHLCDERETMTKVNLPPKSIRLRLSIPTSNAQATIAESSLFSTNQLSAKFKEEHTSSSLLYLSAEDDVDGHTLDDEELKPALSESDSECDPTDEAFYQDANYIYPRVDVSSDLTKDDFSWKPGQRKRPKTSTGQRKIPPPQSFKREKSETEVVDKSQDDTSLKPSKDVKKPATDKPKKGFSTPKQRLGKLLKLHQTGSRYIRK